MVATIGLSSRDGQNEKARPTLTLRRIGQALQNRSEVATNERAEHTSNFDEVQCFEAWLWDARNDWSIAQAKRGLFSARKLSKDDADRLLKRELALIGRDA